MTRTRWIWVSAALVLIVGGVTATVLVMREDWPTTSGDDCGVVGELAREWTTSVQQDQTGERSDKFAEKVRGAADSVSTPALKNDLNKWADGFALQAEVQRDDANNLSPTPEHMVKIRRAGEAIYRTADALHAACPAAWPSQS